MQIEVELTEHDHSNFYREYGFRMKWKLKAVILLLVDFLICICLNILVWQLVILFVFLLFPFFFVIPYYVSRANFKRQYSNALSPLSHKVYMPFVIGIEIIDEGGERFLRYEGVKRAGKTRNYVFLILSSDEYYILPHWCFSSYYQIDQFLNLVRTGIANAKGVVQSPPATFKPGYLIGLLCLVPLIGGITGIVLVILGLVHYKDKIFVIIGTVGIIITVSLYGSLFYFSQHTDVFKSDFAELTQTQINDLVKNIEFYKLQNGTYPDSLQQLDSKESAISIYDTMNGLNTGSKANPYHYIKAGNRYVLFSVGMDGKPNTADDIYPTLTHADTSKLGFIRKR